MNRERKEVYSPPIIKTVSFVVEMGLGMSTTGFVPLPWDEDTPGSRSTAFGHNDWTGDGNNTTSYEMERW